MADVDERGRYRRGLHEPTQVVDDVRKVGRTRGGVAETQPRTVIRADPGDFRDLSLDAPPGRHTVARSGVEHDRQAARSVAIEIEPPRPVDRDEILRLGVD